MFSINQTHALTKEQKCKQRLGALLGAGETDGAQVHKDRQAEIRPLCFSRKLKRVGNWGKSALKFLFSK